jgi:hypothetical protein
MTVDGVCCVAYIKTASISLVLYVAYVASPPVACGVTLATGAALWMVLILFQSFPVVRCNNGVKECKPCVFVSCHSLTDASRLTRTTTADQPINYVRSPARHHDLNPLVVPASSLLLLLV